MTHIDRGELTQQTYWDQQRGRLKAGSHHTDLDWVRRTYLYASLDRLLRSVLPVDPTKTFERVEPARATGAGSRGLQ